MRNSLRMAERRALAAVAAAATALSQAFVHHGLQLYKVDKTLTHVAVARPNYLDLDTTPVSEGVKRIVDFINFTTKCTRRKLIDALAPSAAPKPILVVPTEGNAPATVVPAAPEPTPEQTAMIADLHWLVHQGHVIEFANGIVETAKKPLPRPPQNPKKPGAPKAEPSAPTQTKSAIVAETPVSETPAEVAIAEVTPAPTVEAKVAAEPVAAEIALAETVAEGSLEAMATKIPTTTVGPSQSPVE